MTVLDAYAVLAFLRGEPAATEVRPLLEAGGAWLTAVGVGEVLDHLVRVAGVDEEEAVLDLAELGLLHAVAVDAAVGTASGRLRARHYHRSRRAVSMADCVAAEITRARNDVLATSDPHLLEVCARESIGVVVLPGSDGTRWRAPA
ncbi:MAG TPA: PIN domain-containing protein [Pseudonocardiaceae bacterium]|nr:PIN domain-containing protein [Pseudonocardiaceae bacterium]